MLFKITSISVLSFLSVISSETVFLSLYLVSLKTCNSSWKEYQDTSHREYVNFVLPALFSGTVLWGLFYYYHFFYLSSIVKKKKKYQFLTILLWKCWINFGGEECKEEIEMVDPKSIADNIPALLQHDTQHEASNEYYCEDPAGGCVGRPFVQVVLVQL